MLFLMRFAAKSKAARKDAMPGAWLPHCLAACLCADVFWESRLKNGGSAVKTEEARRCVTGSL